MRFKQRMSGWRTLCLAVALALPVAGPSHAQFSIVESLGNVFGQPTSFDECPQFFANRTPPKVPSQLRQRELCYEAFAILHSGQTQTPVYVAQRLNRAAIEDADEKRANRFFCDARLRSIERAELSDCKGSGYSRGHMAPAGDMPTATAMEQRFSLANMVPQNIQHKGGACQRSSRTLGTTRGAPKVMSL